MGIGETSAILCRSRRPASSQATDHGRSVVRAASTAGKSVDVGSAAQQRLNLVD